ncbi:phosphoribosylglycinamide formyltransferase [Acidihalobacter aeolianus]|uniref:Phosphoribosylglycinamide formyltransferase n=1 Tax=Acidihalobacter aeolianus TaxID=2792603 RepID=A0A1D8K9C3_9GAMM|nr:phosphoribosylglycinamide formyltransferase [Acidihalobacter aeolianus]AOV17535.1 phosphoribosylglycinamide formyltransferase [Acidihalobacter aeolianus]
MTNTATPRIVVLVSGEGSNLEAILDAVRDGRLQARVAAVISNRPEANALRRAAGHGIAGEALDHRAYVSREAFDEALARAIDAHRPELVVLAGFMRILTPAFVNHYLGRMLNIHPSLLPAYPGLHTHARALADGAERHGASVHFVTAELDGGPVVLQGWVPIRTGDTPENLASRVLEVEHCLYPLAIGWFVAGRLRLDGKRATLDGIPLERPWQLDYGAEAPHP